MWPFKTNKVESQLDQEYKERMLDRFVDLEARVTMLENSDKMPRKPRGRLTMPEPLNSSSGGGLLYRGNNT